MKIQRLGGLAAGLGALYVLPDTHAPLQTRSLAEQQAVALAGPFATRKAAADWIVAYFAAKLADGPDRELYDTCWVACGGLEADPFILIAILGAISRRIAVARIRRMCGRWSGDAYEVGPLVAAYPDPELNARAERLAAEDRAAIRDFRQLAAGDR